MTVKQRLESKIGSVSNVEVSRAIERMENVVGFKVTDNSNSILINRLCEYVVEGRIANA